MDAPWLRSRTLAHALLWRTAICQVALPMPISQPCSNFLGLRCLIHSPPLTPCRFCPTEQADDFGRVSLFGWAVEDTDGGDSAAVSGQEVLQLNGVLAAQEELKKQVKDFAEQLDNDRGAAITVEKGAMSPPGPIGPEGAPGPEGGVGGMGPPGPRGFMGKAGDIGVKGDKGLPGPDGARGVPGPAGPMGLPGGKGERFLPCSELLWADLSVCRVGERPVIDVLSVVASLRERAADFLPVVLP